jgi:SOS-response transcriptional repressor LexA
MTQIQFAEKIGVVQGIIAAWESGKKNPSNDNLVKIAALTTNETLKRQLLDASGLSAFVSQSEPNSSTDGRPALSVNLLHDPAAAGTPRMVDEREIETTLDMPLSLFRDGHGNVVAIRVKGGSMEPLILSGAVVFIDVSQRDPKKLVNSLVAARVDGGITIKFLRRTKSMYILVAYHVSPRYDVMPLSELDGDGIVGRVLGWFSESPKK